MNVSENATQSSKVESSFGFSSDVATEEDPASSDEPGSCKQGPIRSSWFDGPLHPAFWMICGAFSFTLMGGMANILGSRCDWRIVAQFRTIFSFLAAAGLTLLAGAGFVVLRPNLLWVRSIAGTLSLVSTFYALTHLPVADVLTLTNTYPLWIVAIGFLAWGESVEGSILVAIVSAVIGVVLIQQPHLEGNRFALLTALAAAFFTSVAMMGLNRLGRVDPRAVVTHFSAVACVALMPLHFFGQPADFGVLKQPSTLALLVGVGVTGTIGQIFLTKAYAAGSAPRIAVIGMSQVAMGLVFDMLYRQRMPPVFSLAGMALVVGPVIWLILRGKGRVNPHSSRKTSLTTTVSMNNLTMFSGRTKPVSSDRIVTSRTDNSETRSRL